jgi:hypothetical protein
MLLIILQLVKNEPRKTRNSSKSVPVEDAKQANLTAANNLTTDHCYSAVMPTSTSASTHEFGTCTANWTNHDHSYLQR